MTQKTKHIFMLFASILLMYTSVYAQKNKETLQKKYNTILTDIKGIEGLIEQTESQKEKSLNQLQSLSAKINSRENLITNINEQILVLDENIVKKKVITKSMEKDISVLKEDYAKMIYHSYKNLNTTSVVSFLLSSETFNQALRRLNYLKSYANYRQTQAVLLKETINGIQLRVEKLEAEKAEKEQLLLEEERQKGVLMTEKLQKNNLVTKLKGDAQNLKSQIKKKNSSAIALNNQIQKIIQKEILAAEAKAKKASEKNTAEAEAFVTKEIKLSKDFVNNKGKLPWPVNTGHVVEKFGTHPHPSLPKVTVNNNGIDIRTDESQNAKAIFEGVVVNSFYLPTTQNTLIIKHGEYFTVYSNLKTISVNLGDKVTTNQKIGIAYTDDEKITKVHLEVWKSTTKLNPELWIKASI